MRKQRPELPQGTLDMLVLKALSLGPMHGYGVGGQRIGQLAEEVLKVEDAVSGVVPHRAARVDQGEWRVSENHRLTRTGRKQLEVERAQWSHLSLAIGEVLRTA